MAEVDALLLENGLLPINDSRWEKLIAELHNVCTSKNDALVALQHLVAQASELIEWVPANAPADNQERETDVEAEPGQLNQKDIELLLEQCFSFLKPSESSKEEQSADISLPDSRVMAPLMRVLSSTEKDAVLHRALQATRCFSGGKKEGVSDVTLSDYPVGALRSWMSQLASSVTQAGGVNLQLVLVLIKLLLSLVEESVQPGGGLGETFREFDTLSSADLRPLLRQRIPSQECVNKQRALVRRNEFVRQFGGEARLCVVLGQPEGLSKDTATNGELTGLVSSVSARTSTFFYEAVLENYAAADDAEKLRFGWAVCGSDFNKDNQLLGADEHSWAFNKHSMQTFHNANALIAERQRDEQKDDDAKTAGTPQETAPPERDGPVEDLPEDEAEMQSLFDLFDDSDAAVAAAKRKPAVEYGGLPCGDAPAEGTSAQKRCNPWQIGDVVGSMLDCEQKTIRFFLNGKEVANATFEGVEIPSAGLTPAFSTSGTATVAFNFGDKPFKFVPEGYCIPAAKVAPVPVAAAESVDSSETKAEHAGDVQETKAPELPNADARPLRTIQEAVQTTCVQFDGHAHVSVAPDTPLKLGSGLTISACVQLGPVDEDPSKIYTILSHGAQSEPCGYRFGATGAGALAFRVNGVFDYKTKDGVVPRNAWTEVTVAYSHANHNFTFFVDGQQVETHALQPKPAVPIAAVKNGVVLGALRDVPPTEAPPSSEAAALAEAGAEVNKPTDTPADPPSSTTATETAVDAAEAKFTEGWVGYIADIRVWSVCKQASELLLGRLSVLGTEKELVAYWRFAEGAGSRVHDCAPAVTIWSPCHGTLGGAAAWHDFAIEPLIQAPTVEQEMDEAAGRDSNETGLLNVLQVLCKYICHNLSQFADEDGSYRQLQMRLAPTKLLVDPHVLHFLLARSVLTQAFRLLQVATDANMIRVVGWSAACVLDILKANLRHVQTQGISPGSVGLMMQVPTSSDALTFSQRLLTAMLLFCCTSDPDQAILLPWGIAETDHAEASEAAEIRELASVVRTTAAQCFVEGLNIFFPEPHDVLFLLEKLFLEQVFPVLTPDVLAQLSPDVALELLSPASRLLLQEHVSKKLVNWGVLSQLLVPLLRVQLLGDQPSRHIVVGDFVHPTEHCIDRTPQTTSGRVVEITSWCGDVGKGVRVLWETGSLNLYRYGVIFQGHAVFDVKSVRSQALQTPIVSNDAAQDSEVKPVVPQRMQVLYTAHEVRHALLNDIGTLTKRTVIRYLKEVAPEEWQQSHKLTWAESALLKDLSMQDTVSLYDEFYQQFALEPESPRTATSHSGAEPLDDSPRVVRVLKAIIAQAMSCRDPSDNTLSLLAGVQSLLLGATLTTSTPQTEAFVPRQLKLDEKLAVTPVAGQTHADKKWVWQAGQVVPFQPPVDSSTAPAQINSSALQVQPTIPLNPSAWRFDTTIFPEYVTYTNEGATATATEKRRWITLRIAKLIFPGTGIHQWTLSIDSCRKHHLAFGVCSVDANLNRPLMADGSSWAIGMKRSVFATTVNISNEYGADIEESEVLMVTYDSDNGTVSFKNMSTLADYGVAFGGVRTPVYPAVSMFHADDRVTVGDASLFVTPLRPKATPLPKVDVNAGLSGIPSRAASEYVAALLEACNTTAAEAISSNAGLATFTSTVMASLLPQALGRIARWQFPPLNAEALVAGLSQLAKSIGGLSETFVEDSPEKSLALQLLAVLACLQGRLLAFKIHGGWPQLNNELLALEEAALQTDGVPTMKTGPGLPAQGVHHWLTNPILQKGIRSPAEMTDELHGRGHMHGHPMDTPEDLFVRDLIENRGAAASLEEWVATHDGIPQAFRKLGGAVVGRAVRASFASMLWHSGYIDSALKLAEHTQSIAEQGQEIFTAFKARVPPFFLLRVWQKAQAIRSWTKGCKDDGIAYELLGPNIVRRALFLLDIEHMAPEQPAHWLIQEYIADSATSHVRDAQHIRALENALAANIDHVSSFIKDGTQLHEITAALRFAEDRAVIKAGGYKALRVFLATLPSSLFWSKVAALLHLPDAVHGISPSKLAPEKVSARVQDRQSNFQSGHYMFQLDGCSLAASQMLSGSFDNLYAFLASELSVAAQEQAPELQMALLDCWGIMLSEQDHDMLARVRIFSVLQELLESTVPGEWVVSPGARTPVSEGATSPKNAALPSDASLPVSLVSQKRIAKAVMKLVYLLALQVASTGDDTSSAGPPDSGPLLGPTLSRARSGPATLSDAVFDMLFSQLTAVMQALTDSHIKLGPTNRILSITEEAFVVLSETSLLLTCVVVAPSCQRILMKPRWMAVLIDLVMLAPAAIRHRALRLLAALLPSCDASLLTPGSEVAEALGRYLEDQTLAAEPVPAQMVALLWHLARLQFAAPESETIITVEGFGRDGANSWDVTPVVADAVGLIRQLLRVDTWKPFLHAILLQHVQCDDSSFKSVPALQAFGVVCSVFGGLMDSLFLGCGAEMLSAEAKNLHAAPGIVVAIEPRFDTVDVAAKNKQDQRVLCKLNLDQVRPLNRTPFDLLAVDESLWVPVLSMAYRLCAASIETSAAAPHDADATPTSEEKQEEKELEESKEQSTPEIVQDAETSVKSFPFDLLVAMVQCAAARSVSSILSQSSTVDSSRTTSLLQDPALAELGAILLKKAVAPTRSCGVGDIVVLEDYAQLLAKHWRSMHAHGITRQAEEQATARIKAVDAGAEAETTTSSDAAQPTTDSQQPDAQLAAEQAAPQQEAADTAVLEAAAAAMNESDDAARSAAAAAAAAEGAPAESSTHPAVAQLEAMGFPTAWCVRALELNNFDMENALNYILANGEELENMIATSTAAGQSAETASFGGFGQAVSKQEEEEDDDEDEDGDLILEDDEPPTPTTIPAEISEINPCQFHYVHTATKLLPLFAAPNFQSDRLGVLFPGDDVLAIGIDSDWLKVNLDEYDEEAGETEWSGDNLGADSEQYAWIPRFVDGHEMIMLGRSKGADAPPLATPPADTYPIRATFQVVGSHGLRVREGSEMSSQEVTVLSQGELISTIEETINSEGSLRLHIQKPVRGWVTKRRSLVKKIGGTMDSQADEPEVDAAAAHGPVDEERLLTQVEDHMENSTGEDLYRKDDRYFGSMQGKAFSPNTQDSQNARRLQVNRRSRLMGATSSGASEQLILQQTVPSIQAGIVKVATTLANLHCRAGLFALMVQSISAGTEHVIDMFLPHSPAAHATATNEENPQPQGNNGDIISSSCHTCEQLSMFVRLSCFRGEHTIDPLWRAKIQKEIGTLALHDKFVSAETFVGLFLQRVLAPLNPTVGDATTKTTEHANDMLRALYQQISRHLRLATTPSHGDMCWDEYFADEDEDEQCLRNCSIPFAQWLTKVILQAAPHPDIFLKLFRFWTVGLRGASLSLKSMTCKLLVEMLLGLSDPQPASFSQHVHQAFAIHPAKVLEDLRNECAAMLPEARLRRLAAMRYSFELEEHPMYSRYLQSLVLLLDSIAAAQSMRSGAQEDGAAGLADKQRDASLAAPALVEQKSDTGTTRRVVKFSADRSHVAFAPQQELEGPWTVEFWLIRDHANLEVLEPKRSTSGGVAKRKEQVPWGVKKAGRGGAKPGPTRTPKLIRSDSIQAAAQDSASGLFGNVGHAQQPSSMSFGQPIEQPTFTPAPGAFGGLPASTSLFGRAPTASSAFASSNSAPQQSLSNFGLFGSPTEQGGFGGRQSTSLFGGGRGGPHGGGRFGGRGDGSRGDGGRGGGGRGGGRQSFAEWAQSHRNGNDVESSGRGIGTSLDSSRPEEPSAPGIRPSYLLRSSNVDIKLQLGGRLFGEIEQDDASNGVVADKALCFGISVRNAEDHVFDYVMPTGKWTHLALVCRNHPWQIELYENGQLIDALPIRTALPLAMIGDKNAGSSFDGRLADMRAWGYARSASELTRDMLRDVSGFRGLLAYLPCNEGHGQRLLDHAHALAACSLSECEWVTATDAPTSRPVDVPRHLLREEESANAGIYDTQDTLNLSTMDLDQTEMTGILTRMACSGAAGELSKQVSEVVSLFFQQTSSTADSDGWFPILGYLHWNEAEARSMLEGGVNGQNIRFNLGDVIQGCPKSVKALTGATFTGQLTEDGLQGEWLHHTRVPALPPLAKGAFRVDRSQLPESISATTQGVNPHIAVIGNTNLPCTAIIEANPINVPQKPVDFFTLPTENTFSNHDVKDAVQAAGSFVDDVFSSMLSEETKSDASDVESKQEPAEKQEEHAAEDSEKRPFGFVSGKHWLSWLVGSSRSSNLTIGFCAHGSSTTELAGSNPNSWGYRANGQGWHANACISGQFSSFSQMDVIQLELDLSDGVGTARFYKNGVHEGLQFGQLLSHPAFSATSVEEQGLRICVSLTDVSESVTLLGYQAGRAELTYSHDLFDRRSFTFDLENGYAGGKGILRYTNSKNYWRGHWSADKQHGVQLYITVDDDGQEVSAVPYLFDRGIQIRQATNLEAFELLEEWKAVIAASTKAAATAETTSDQKHEVDKKRKKVKKRSKGAPHESSAESAAPAATEPMFSFSSSPPQQPSTPFGNPFAAAAASAAIPAFNHFESAQPATPTPTPTPTPTMTPVDVDAKIDELISSSTAMYLLQIVCPTGATVRTGVEIDDSLALRTAQTGDIVEAFAKAQTKEGIPRYQISDGWVSERLRSSGEEPVAKVLRHLPAHHLKYQITYDGGAKLRRGAALDSEEVGSVPLNTVVEVAEQRRMVAADTMRLRIVSPPEFEGWISLKLHLAKLLEEVDQVALNTEVERRAAVRRRRQERKSTATQEEANQRFINATIKANMSVSSKRFFLLNKKQCSPGTVLSEDLLTATCDPNVQSENMLLGGGRSMVMATRGFTRGVHYWEVQVNSAQWGSVFIGVAPKDSSNWNGYGFLNYRATQRFGSETLYGSYYGNGDTIGVLLDMDHGTIAFVKDGEDFNVGKMVVNNMGIAYHNLRRSSRSSLPELYPCFGMKNSGDQLSISRSRWFSWKGCAEDKMLENALESLNLLRTWQRCTVRERCLPQEITARLYPAYRQWRNSQRARYRTRAGLEVELDASEEGLSKALGPLAEAYPVMVGQKIQTMYGEGKIVGVARGDVWFTLEGNESGAWYWSREHLTDLVSSGMVNLEMEGGIALTRQYSDLSKLPLLAEEQFQEASTAVWTSDEDEQLTRLVNKLSDSLGVDPFNIPPGNIIQAAATVLASKSAAEIQTRFVALRALNKAAATVLPLIDVARAACFLGVTESEVANSQKLPSLPVSIGSASNSLVRAMRGKVFTRVKTELWQLVLRESTTFTQPPPDEYERPDEIREIVLNRMQAHQALQSAEALEFDDKLRMSLFGQLLEGISGWDDRQLRRSFVHMQDAGQPRAFYVKFTGEGVDDHGGPYRAAFQTAVGEEPQQLLDILTPCPNAKNAQGENRDKFVLNTLPHFGRLFRHLGRMLGLACRHRILVPLSLPTIVWRPLCSAALRLQDLQAVDLSLMQSLNAIEHTPAPGPDVADLLRQALGSAIDMVPAADLQRLEESDMAEPALVSRIVQLIYQLQLRDSKGPLQQFFHGLAGVVPVELFNLFTPFELEATFCGMPDVSVDLLKRVTEYDCVSPTDPHIVAFWRVVEEMSAEERSALINFCSGRARLPGSAQELHMNFKLTAPPPRSVDSPDDYLPIAQTCFFSLSLPRYSSETVLAEKLRYAISNANLMDADFMMRNAQGWEDIH